MNEPDQLQQRGLAFFSGVPEGPGCEGQFTPFAAQRFWHAAKKNQAGQVRRIKSVFDSDLRKGSVWGQVLFLFLGKQLRQVSSADLDELS